MLSCVALAVLSAACGESPTAPEPPAPRKPPGLVRSFLPCSLAEIPGTTWCGSYGVYEDRAAGSGRTIILDVVVAKATTANVEDDPVIYFHGGPGGSSVSNAVWVAPLLAGARQQRDLVFIDQRGTGESGRLSCDGGLPGGQATLFGTHFPDAHIASCRATLAAVADLRQYTTAIAADDISEVLAWLGYDQVNLFGASYGTRLALVFLRRHEERVRSILLNGVAPPHRGIHLNGATNTDAALDWLISDCESNPACSGAYPTFRADLAALLARFDSGTVPIDVELSDGTTATVDYSRGDFGYAIRRMLYDESAYSIAPWARESVQTGGWSGFPSYYLDRTRWVSGSFGTGMHLSVICSEDIQFVTEPDIAARTAGTRLGSSLIDRYRNACAHWPAGTVPAQYRDVVRSGKPALIVSGERDPVTPALWGDETAQGLTNSRHLVVPGAGHFPVSPCIELIQNTFLLLGDPGAVATECVQG